MSVTFADGREPLSAQCLKGRGEVISPTPPRAALAPLVRGYVESLRFTPCRIRHGMLVNAAEMVRRQCPARTPLAAFFNSLLVDFTIAGYFGRRGHRRSNLDLRPLYIWKPAGTLPLSDPCIVRLHQLLFGILD